MLKRSRGVGGLVRSVIGSALLGVRERLVESNDVLWQKSRTRWRHAKPTTGLTWGTELSGDAFVEKAVSFGAFASDRAILEIGPGYGRLLTSCFRLGVPYQSYCAVDISATNIEWLREHFEGTGARFIVGDVETVSFDTRFDVVISSLTFKHLYPTFETGLANLVKYMNVGGMMIFDLREGMTREFEADRVTYIRCYTRPEVVAILLRSGMELVAFEVVVHDPDHRRLLVVARKRESGKDTYGLSPAGN